MKLTVAAALATLGAVSAAAPSVRDLIANMTLLEKYEFLGGSPGPYVGNVPGLSRLDLPALSYNDGPQGFRDDARPGTSTALPCGLSIASTFDPTTAAVWGHVLGAEFFEKGANVMLGPGINVARVPRNGRNFEYVSGEDPFLGSEVVRDIIVAAQSHKIVANAKHWVNNNQETERERTTAIVDDRTRFEMYYPPFEAAIMAGVGSFMCSYNKIRSDGQPEGKWSCENEETLQKDLKERLGFAGYVMSDWGATHSTSLEEGLDQEMPWRVFFNENTLSSFPEERIDAALTRILTPFVQVGAFDLTQEEIERVSIKNNVTNDDHFQKARFIAIESTVLLTNKNGLLPLSFEGLKVVVYGNQAAETMVGGGGSGEVQPSWKPTYLDVVHATVANAAYGSRSDDVTFVGDDQPLASMQAAALSSDICLFFTHAFSSEGYDRPNLSLEDDWYVKDVAPSCLRSVAIVTTPGATILPWKDAVDAILVNWYPGVAGAFALMDVLRGDAEPSGRLPITFPVVENQEGMTTKQYPGLNAGLQATYSERWDFGYRFYHAHNEEPAFWFGEGMSFTEFSIENVAWKDRDVVGATIKNTGTRTGKTVPQLYLRFPDECDEPLWSLRGFEKVELGAGEERIVEFHLQDRSFSVYDGSAHEWKVCSGLFHAAVGFSANVGVEAIGQNKVVFKVD